MLLDLLHDKLSGLGLKGVHRRPRIPAVCSAALAALVAPAMLAGGPVDTAHADDAQVTVISPGGSQQTLSLDALGGNEDVRERAYALRSASGEGSQAVTGFSLAAILEAAGVDPYGFSYLEAQRPTGGSVLLSRHQALDPRAFADGPPVVYATAAGTGFLRPTSGPGDINATDSFEAPQGITIVLGKDSPTASPRRGLATARRAPARRSPSPRSSNGAGSGEQLSYSWYFDDGHSAAGPTSRHSFAKRGSYDVVVGVTTPGDRAGASAVVTVQVGAPPAGPDRKGGGTQPRRGGARPRRADGTGGAVPPGPATPSPRTTAAPSPAPRETKREIAPEQPPGEPVSGLLLTSAETTTPEPETAAARTGKLSRDGDGAGLPGAALGLLVTVGLLGAGALIETRSLLR